MRSFLPTIFESEDTKNDRESLLSSDESDIERGRDAPHDARMPDADSTVSKPPVGKPPVGKPQPRPLTPQEEELITHLKRHFDRRDAMFRANLLCTEFALAILLIVVDFVFYMHNSTYCILGVAIFCVPFMCRMPLLNFPLWISIFMLIYFGWTFVAGQFTVAWVRH